MYRIAILVACVLFVAGCGHARGDALQDQAPEELADTSDQGPEVEPEQAHIIYEDLETLNERYICAGQRWKRYYIGDTGISFCYDMAWGEPKLDEIDARRGLYGSVTFEPSRFYDEVSYRPSVWFEIVDLVRHDSDVPQVNFHRAYNEASHEMLKRYFHLEESAMLTSVEVDTKPGWRASNIAPMTLGLELEEEDLETRIGYYMPYASGEYHVQASARTHEADELDMLAQSMRFDDN